MTVLPTLTGWNKARRLRILAAIMDVFTKHKRSEVMGRIRSRKNKDTELALLALLRKQRIRGWRRNSQLFGKPDFVFTTARIAVFVDGCFWHGCRKHSRPPQSHQQYWHSKLLRNKMRDLAVARKLRNNGWSVIRIWEHDVSKRPSRCVARIIKKLSGSVNLQRAADS